MKHCKPPVSVLTIADADERAILRADVNVMASWCPNIDEAVSELHRDTERYLAAVDTFREEGYPPEWSNAGEWLPEESVYVPSHWKERREVASVPVERQRSWRPQEEDGS